MEETLKHEVYLPKNNTIASFAIKTRDWTAEYTLKRERLDKEQAQIDYCKKIGYPIFAQSICFKCSAHVFDKYTLEECVKEIITGCKNCCASFVD
jgi:hypothetical protein